MAEGWMKEKRLSLLKDSSHLFLQVKRKMAKLQGNSSKKENGHSQGCPSTPLGSKNITTLQQQQQLYFVSFFVSCGIFTTLELHD